MKNSRYDKAFTLIEILIVVAIIGIISAIALPNFFKAKTMAYRNACVSNLAHIRSAVDMWALEYNTAPGVTPQMSNLTPDFIRTWPKCLNSAYVIPAIGSDPACPNGIADHVLPPAGGA